MPLRHTEAIVLRTYRVGEADKVAVFLTRDLGKVRGMAKGARRPRSRFGGSLEIATEIELGFFEKEGNELVSVNHCDIIRSWFSSSGDPILACTLAYFADLVDTFAPEREPNAKLYRLMKASVASLISGSEPEQTTRYFEAWVLRLGGFYPRGRTCSTCGRALAREGAHYLAEQHQLRCSRCTRNGLPLSPESLRYLQQIWHSPPAKLPAPDRRHVLGELAGLHRKLVGEQIDKELNSLQVLEDLMRQERRP